MRDLRVIGLTALFLGFASETLARDIATREAIEQCNGAIREEDVNKAKRIAEYLDGKIIPTTQLDEIIGCYDFAFSDKHSYSRILKAVVLKTKKLQLENSKTAAASANQIYLERLSLERKKVVLRSRIACDKLYLKDANEAVTRQVCLDSFMENGLPD